MAVEKKYEPHVDPWFVTLNIPPEKVRQQLLESPKSKQSFISQEAWEDFLERKSKGQLVFDRGANTTLRCPGCRKFLRHFYITIDTPTLKKAKIYKRIHRLISGYICWFPCDKTYFLEEEAK